MPRLTPARLLAALRADATQTIALPGDVVRNARRRVQVAASLGTLAYAAFLALELSGVVPASPLERRIDLAHDVIGLVVCATLWIISFGRAFRDHGVLAAALAVEVILATLISVAVPWASFVRTSHVAGLTWVVPMIVLFPLLVPMRPRTAVLVSTACAAAMPVGLLALAARGAIELRVSDVVSSAVTGGVAVGIALVAAHTIYGAERQAAAVRTLGSYELVERLGQGGMGEVWKAQHLLLARPAAVKLILPEFLQGPREQRDALRARFAREAQVTASLRCPHTVELYDFGVSSEGVFYYVMELLDGMTVQHFVYRHGPLEPRRAVHWLMQACHSLGEAHARQLVHRDIKPANLYVCRHGRELDFVKVLDFGLTKPASGEEAALTAPGARLGTPGYMAPEQIFGMETDARTDLYALGCVGYWLLTGSRPFEADNAGEMFHQHVHATPAPLSGRTGHPVPERLEALILACLAKDPKDRPRDADELCGALASSVTEPWTAGDARAWWAAHGMPN